MEQKDKQPTEYEKYCAMLFSPAKRGSQEGVAQQQMDDMDETIDSDHLTEYMPEGVFVRGH